MRHTNFNVLLIILLSTPMTSDVKQNQDNTLYEDIFSIKVGLIRKMIQSGCAQLIVSLNNLYACRR